MSVLQRIGATLSFGFVFGISGAAFARQPPALVQLQEAAARATAGCVNEASNGNGYRDVAIRFAAVPRPSTAAQDERAACVLNRERAGSGYRDIFIRPRPVEGETRVVAGAERPLRH